MNITKKLLDRIKNIPANSKLTAQFDANATNLLQFNVALNEVISKIESSEPVFVKCIKPNENSFSNQFVSNVAVKQIRDAGLIEYARTRKFNFPLKVEFDAFVKRYQALAKALNLSTDVLSPKEVCFKIMQSYAVRNFRLGATKVFIKYEELDALDKEQESLMSSNQGGMVKPKLNAFTQQTQKLDTDQQNEQPRPLHYRGSNVNRNKVNRKSDLAAENLHDEQKSTQQPDSIQPKLEQEYWWDVAKVTSRDFEIEQLQLRSRLEIFKIIFKLFAYVIFFMIVLTSSVVSKLSLFTMINAFKKENQPDVYVARWAILIASAISVPYVWSTITHLFTVLFSSQSGRPGFFIIIWVIFSLNLIILI
jgi:chitin synthase